MRFFLLCFALALTLNAHPLDPLNANEIKAAATILTNHQMLGQGWYLQELSLKEPSKDAVLANAALPRLATAVLVNLPKNKNLECVIDLGAKKIVSQKPIVRGQPAIMDNEYAMIESIVRADPRFAEAMKVRGITKLEEVHVEQWGSGEVRSENVDRSHRLGRAVFYYQATGSKNPYSRPIEGPAAIVDLTTQTVADFIDTGIKPVSTRVADFFFEMGPDAKLASRTETKKQTHAAIKIDGSEVAWKNWRFHVGVNYREGMVISLLNFVDHGKMRPILYRGSLSEMVVPYADPSRNWYWRAAFDEGEYSVGPMTQTLTAGVHVPDDALLFDVALSSADGSPKVISNGLALYERDGGLLWSHFDTISGDVAAKRGRELVAMHMFTVGNYDYALTWVFKEDGSVEVQALLTGIIAVKGADTHVCERCKGKTVASNFVYAGKLEDDFGTVVDKNLIGITHEHFFNFRLDFAVDGAKNSVAEYSFEKTDDKTKNPHGNMFVMSRKVLGTELESGRDAAEVMGRKWVVFNPNVKNSLGHFPAYAIVPGPGAKPLQQENSKVSEQAGFLKHNLWVTKFAADEKNAAGTYPNQNPGDGVSKWVARNANIHNEDIVAWYTMGLIHLPCPEDWPVMPVTKAGFMLKPMGFFTQNPTLTMQDESVVAQK